MYKYKNEKHNEAARVEDRMSDLYSEAINLSNWLFNIDPVHPLLDDVRSAIHAIEDIDFEAPYEDAKALAGKSWWDEVED